MIGALDLVLLGPVAPGGVFCATSMA